MTIKAKHQEGMAFEVEIRGHKLTSDLTPDKGGKDLGPSPPELLLGALAACSGIFAAMFAQRNGLSPQGIEAEATAEMAQSPMRLNGFSVRVRFPGLPEELKEKAKAFIEACVVGNTLKNANSVVLEIES